MKGGASYLYVTVLLKRDYYYLEPDVGVKNTIFAFAKTFTIFYLKIYNFKVKVRLILT